MPRDPTQVVSEDQHLPTPVTDIGHLAPDFSDRRHFNTLVIRPQISVRPTEPSSTVKRSRETSGYATATRWKWVHSSSKLY